jgi:hypothetical protein
VTSGECMDLSVPREGSGMSRPLPANPWFARMGQILNWFAQVMEGGRSRRQMTSVGRPASGASMAWTFFPTSRRNPPGESILLEQNNAQVAQRRRIARWDTIEPRPLRKTAATILKDHATDPKRPLCNI